MSVCNMSTLATHRTREGESTTQMHTWEGGVCASQCARAVCAVCVAVCACESAHPFLPFLFLLGFHANATIDGPQPTRAPQF